MKKLKALGILACICVVVLLIVCRGKYYNIESRVISNVVECEEANFHPDAKYVAIANMYSAQNNLGQWSANMSLANANGKYDYRITIIIDGQNYTVIREEPFEVGQKLEVIKVETYVNKRLIKTEYK